MSNNLRAADLIHSGALNTNTGTSSYAYVGSANNIAIYIISDTSSNIAVQAITKIDGSVSAGRNTDLSGSTWCNYNGFTSVAITSTPLCIGISPFAPQYVRVINLTGGTNIANLTVLVETNG